MNRKYLRSESRLDDRMVLLVELEGDGLADGGSYIRRVEGESA
jgi:hypothetical protein